MQPGLVAGCQQARHFEFGPFAARIEETTTSPATSIHDHYADAQQVLDGLSVIGVDYDDMVQQLEDDGVAKLDARWDHLDKHLAIALRQHAGAP